MHSNQVRRCALLTALVLASTGVLAETTTQASAAASAPTKNPLIIGHRGASGYAPEHTLASYALAILQGADYIEPDLVSTRDGYLVARHDNELSLTTNVAELPEFANRKRTKVVEKSTMTGWFSEDFTLAELKKLRAIERIPNIRPANRRMDGDYKIPTLQEIIDLVKSMQVSQQRVIGLYPETKHPTYFQNLGLSLEEPLVKVLTANGYNSPKSPVFIQSFEINNLKKLKKMTRLRLIQLTVPDAGQPYDQYATGGTITNAQMATPEGLKAIAQYAAGVGPYKEMVIPRDASGNLGKPTDYVSKAHAAKLLVHPWTFRAENNFLPTSLKKGVNPRSYGNIQAEIKAYYDAGIDGLFIDQPDIAARLRENR